MRFRAALTTALILVISLLSLHGQNTSDYTFARTTNGSLTDMSSANQIFAANADIIDQTSGIFNIGFTFNYCGVNYTQFSLGSNGFIRLGGTPLTSDAPNTAANTAYLLPFHVTGYYIRKSPDGRIQFKTTGSSPNRVTTIEWRNVQIPYGNYSLTTTSTFQIRLYENTRKIEYVYGTLFNRDPLNNLRVEFGLSNSNVRGSVSNVDNPHLSTAACYSRSTSFFSTSFASGQAVSGLSSTANGSRVVLSFTPPAAGAILNPIAVHTTNPTATSGQLNWTLNPANNWVMISASTEGYLNPKPVNGTSYSVGSSLPGGGTVIYRGGDTQFNHSNLIPNRAYYYTFWSWNASNVYSQGVSTPFITLLVGNPPLTLDATSSHRINLSWSLNYQSNPVLLLYNTADSFGTPQNDRIYQPGEMIGSATVLYYGPATSYVHENLEPFTRYYYRKHSYLAPYYSGPTSNNQFTLRSMPFLEDFEASSSLPSGWSSWSPLAVGRGVNGSRGISVNLGAWFLVNILNTDTYGDLPEEAILSFDYRLLSSSGFPANPFVITGNEIIDVLISTNKGNSYSSIGQINATNHIASTQYCRVSFPIPGSLVSPGQHIRVRLRAQSGTTGFYVEIDNVGVQRDPDSPKITLSPEEINFGEVNIFASSEPQQFTITNTGTGQLIIAQPILQGPDTDQFVMIDPNSYPQVLSENQSFSLSLLMRPTRLGLKTASLVFSDNLGRAHYSIPLEGISTDIHHSGGGDFATDAGGYFYANNLAVNAPSVPTFQWVEPSISPISNPVDIGNHSAGSWGPFILPFNFNFFGMDHSEIYINTNGTISFGAPNLITTNTILPTPGLPNNLIALFWDDLEYFPGHSSLHFETTPSSVAISYIGFGMAGTAYDPANSITAQLILYSSGRIKKQYQSVTGAWTPTIGLENHDGSKGLQYHYNGQGGPYRRELRNQGIAIVYGDDPQTLPVQLSSFTALFNGPGMVRLAWTVESQTNHLGYQVFRSDSNRLTDAILVTSTILSYGQSNGSQIQYQFEDTELMYGSEYWYWLLSIDLDGSHRFYGPAYARFESSDSDTPSTPTVTALLPAYPNPFNPSTRLSYSLRSAESVKLDIYNARGQLVRSYFKQHDSPGTYSIVWNGTDMNGSSVSSGVFFYKMSTGNYNSTRKMFLMK